MADEWAAFKPDTAPSDPWASFKPAAAPDIPPASTWPGMMEVAKREAEPILQAFGHGFMRTMEPESLGLSKEAVEMGAKVGFFESKDKYTGWAGPFHAFNELLAHAAVGSAQTLYRSIPALLAGAQEANDVAGRPIPRDVLSIPDAFMGSPHALATPKPWVEPTPISPIENAPLSRVEAAQTGIRHVDAVLNSPTTKTVIENPVVDRSHTVPYTADFLASSRWTG